jgi:lipid-A-disaccharide synthase
MEVADRLGCKVVVAGAPARCEADYAPYLAGRQNVGLLFGRTYDILRYADAAVVNSGTASLEAALIGTPQVVCWSGSKLTVFVARHIFRVGDHLSFIILGNLIVGREAFRELIQEDFTADKVTDELKRLTGDAEYRARMLSDYADIRGALGGSGASRAVADAMIKELRK